jgi:predicted permease
MIEVCSAIIKLALIAFFGFYLYRKHFIADKALTVLTSLVVNFTVPFLIFSGLIQNSRIVLTHSLGTFIAISISIFLVGYILSFLSTEKSKPAVRKEFISIVSLQNGGYLPMTIVFFLFPADLSEQFLVYIFLYLFGYNIIMWSIGSFLIFRKKGEIFHLKSIFTPPALSIIFALLFIYSNSSQLIPKIMLQALRMIGNLSFVLSLIILGCWLAKIKPKSFSQHLSLIVKASFLRLIIVPFLFLTALVGFKIFSLLGTFIVLEACMPSAVSLPIIANIRKADSEFVSQGVFATHVLGIVTIPLWLILLKFLGFSFQ